MIRYATPPRTEDERPCGSWERVLKPSLKADKLGAYGIWGGLDPDERGRLGVGS